MKIISIKNSGASSAGVGDRKETGSPATLEDSSMARGDITGRQRDPRDRAAGLTQR